MAGSQLGIGTTKEWGAQKGRGLSLKGSVPEAGPGASCCQWHLFQPPPSLWGMGGLLMSPIPPTDPRPAGP